MECPHCHHTVTLEADFCDECGASLRRACGACGSVNRLGAKFCRKCGHIIGEAVSDAPHAYTPKHLADRILTSRSALEGERKQVTVLFCDIVDSFRLADVLGPEAMHQVMDQALRLMADAVHRYDGTVNQFLGDGLMALFGAPVALEDHALRAAQAALTMLETLAGYNARLREEHGVEIRLRVGLNTGMVVVGKIGDDLRMDYTAIGDTTHLASRMQGLAEPDSILVTQATHRLVESRVRSESVGPVAVKGRQEPVPAYRLLKRRRPSSRLDPSAPRVAHFVGRQHQTALLHESLTRARGGHGQIIGIVGEPGVGKSRLLQEFRRSLEGEPIIWLEGFCTAYTQAIPYAPILEMLRSNFQIDEDDNPLQIREKLRRGVHEIDPGLETVLPFLHELFDISEESLTHLDRPVKRRRTFEAIRLLTATASRRRPLVCVVEDLQWIDQTSEDYLSFVVDNLAGTPLLLIVTHRPGYAVRGTDKSYYTQIALPLLTEVETRTMVGDLLGDAELPPELVRILREKAEGNPLFVEEFTASLLERGVLERGPQGVRFVGHATVEVPATVQDIVRARIDRLQEPIKRTVQNAAVIGREFALRLLARISEVPADVHDYLETLTHVELIHEKRFFPEPEYVFKHAVTQDVAYETLLDRRRRELHGVVGHAIETLYADQLDEHSAILAYHYARSDRQDKAIEYALLAGDRAAGLYANTEARKHYEQALAAIRPMPASARVHRWHVDAIVKLAGVAMTRQEFEQAQRELERARSLAVELEDEPRQARVLYWLGRLEYVRGNFQPAIEFADRSLAMADRLGDEALAAPSVNLLGRAYWWSDLPRAQQMLERNIEQMGRLGNRGEEATAAGFAGMVCGRRGRFERALAHVEHAMRVVAEFRNPFAEAAAYNYRGTVRAQKGEWREAIDDYDQARRVAEAVGDRFRILMVDFLQGQAYTMVGDPSRGRTLIDESLTLAEKIGTPFALAWQKSVLAECLLALGDPDAALATSEETIRVADATGDRFAGAVGERTLADTLLARGTLDDRAEQALASSLRTLEAIGAAPDLARSRLSWARLLALKGEVAPAEAARRSAIEMFRAMDMAWDLERAERLRRDD